MDANGHALASSAASGGAGGGATAPIAASAGSGEPSFSGGASGASGGIAPKRGPPRVQRVPKGGMGRVGLADKIADARAASLAGGGDGAARSGDSLTVVAAASSSASHSYKDVDTGKAYGVPPRRANGHGQKVSENGGEGRTVSPVASSEPAFGSGVIESSGASSFAALAAAASAVADSEQVGEISPSEGWHADGSVLPVSPAAGVVAGMGVGASAPIHATGAALQQLGPGRAVAAALPRADAATSSGALQRRRPTQAQRRAMELGPGHVRRYNGRVCRGAKLVQAPPAACIAPLPADPSSNASYVCANHERVWVPTSALFVVRGGLTKVKKNYSFDGYHHRKFDTVIVLNNSPAKTSAERSDYWSRILFPDDAERARRWVHWDHLTEDERRFGAPDLPPGEMLDVGRLEAELASSIEHKLGESCDVTGVFPGYAPPITTMAAEPPVARNRHFAEFRKCVRRRDAPKMCLASSFLPRNNGCTPCSQGADARHVVSAAPAAKFCVRPAPGEAAKRAREQASVRRTDPLAPAGATLVKAGSSRGSAKRARLAAADAAYAAASATDALAAMPYTMVPMASYAGPDGFAMYPGMPQHAGGGYAMDPAAYGGGQIAYSGAPAYMSQQGLMHMAQQYMAAGYPPGAAPWSPYLMQQGQMPGHMQMAVMGAAGGAGGPGVGGPHGGAADGTAGGAPGSAPGSASDSVHGLLFAYNGPDPSAVGMPTVSVGSTGTYTAPHQLASMQSWAPGVGAPGQAPWQQMMAASGAAGLSVLAPPASSLSSASVPAAATASALAPALSVATGSGAPAAAAGSAVALAPVATSGGIIGQFPVPSPFGGSPPASVHASVAPTMTATGAEKLAPASAALQVSADA
mmetsp:Transcript_7974/g.28440  ORF Transcript_7974/g.28440 Transcript_7974/m.28440 type:complete len:867 (-) Transcript_7974:86-2686(-)